MHVRAIPSSGEQLPVVGLGTWQTFDVGDDTAARARLEQVVAELASDGGRVIDSSPMYGTSEEVVGDIVAKLGVRANLFVATKVWTTGKRRGVEQMNASLRKLRTRPIDLMQVHNLLDVETQLETLGEWKQSGLVRYIGATHYTASNYAEVARIMSKYPLDFIQINYSVGERDAERMLLPLAVERGIAVLANRPFAGGRLFDQIRRRTLPAWAKEIDCTSWSQLLLKFVIAHPAITCAIPGTADPDHLRDNLQAGSGKLPDDAMRELIAHAALGERS
jgi:aryl-alcohol dehydrogenase-like predicted oxidoreductase